MRRIVSGSYGSLFSYLLLFAVLLSGCGKTTTGYVFPSTIVTDISIASPPDKTVYTVGEAFDSRGLVVNARYADQSVRSVPLGNLSIDGFDSSAPRARQVITVNHAGFSAEFDVEIVASAE